MIGLKDAVRGAPVAAFWPTFASVILYSRSPTILNLASLIIMAFTGSMTYTTMRQVKALFEKVRDKKDRRPNRNRNRQHKSKIDYMKEVHELALNLMPNSQGTKVFIALCILIDVMGMLVFLSLFSIQVFLEPDPNVGITGFTILPFIYLFVIICILIWNT